MSKSVYEKTQSWEKKGRIKKIIKVLEGAQSDIDVMCALDSLGNIGSDLAADAVVAFLEAEEKHKRFSSLDHERALKALGGMKSQKAEERLLYELKKRYFTDRQTIIEALGRMGSDQAVQPLLALLKDPPDLSFTEAQEGAAITALGQIKSERAVDGLLEMLAGESTKGRTGIQERILLALGDIRSEKAVDPLIKLLKSPERDIRREAVRALGNIGSDRAVGPILEALQDEETTVRVFCAEALGKIKAEDAVMALIGLLNEQEYRLREKAARALKNIDTPAARDAYQEYRRTRPASKEQGKLTGLCFVFVSGKVAAPDQLLVQAIIQALSLNVYPQKSWVIPIRGLRPIYEETTARILFEAGKEGIEVDLDRVEVCDFNIRAYGVTGMMAVAYL